MKKIKEQKKLLGLEKVTEFTKIVLASGFLHGEKPLSMILKGPISSGKTLNIKQFINNQNVTLTTDLTAWGILSKFSSKLKTREIRHIIVPDFLNALARRATTVNTLLLFINSTSEDGLFPSKTYGTEITEYIDPFGWVLCLTNEGYNRKKEMLKGIGFESRFFIINHKYDLPTINKILDQIITEEKIPIPDIRIKNGAKFKKIKGNNLIFKELETYSQLLCHKSESESEVLRMQKKLQIFLKSNAYLRGDNKVTKEDLEKLKELLPLIEVK